MGADQDRSHLRPQRGRRRQHARRSSRLRPDLGARPVDRADDLRAAGLQGPDLVRRRRRTARSARWTRRPGSSRSAKLGEEIENSFAVGEDGVYIVSDKRMYRFKAGESGRPRIVWQAHYQNSGIVKPSQVNAGSGTTPTIMDNGYVAITDNADPMNVVVYRTAQQAARREAQGLRAAGVRQGRERDRELADHRRTLADRREQLRLPGPVRARTPAPSPSPASPAST